MNEIESGQGQGVKKYIKKVPKIERIFNYPIP